MKRKSVQFLFIFVVFLMPCISANGQVKVQCDEYPELAKKITENVPDGKALFVFEGNDGFTFESDNENLPQPLKNGLLYKVFISIDPPSGGINISFPGAESENINYGRMQLEKTLPAIKNKEIRYFKLSIVKQLIWADQTNARKKVLADIPSSENDALVIIYPNPQNLELQFEGETSSIDRESDRYFIYMKTGNQKLKVKSRNFKETIIELDSLKKEVRYFLIQAPQSGDDIIVEDPNIKTGNYVIETTPPGALIQMVANPAFNERKYKTPFTIEGYKAGTEIITLTLDRYEPITDTILISSSKGKKSKYALIPKFAFINCNIEPPLPISQIKLNGKIVTGIDNGKNFELPKGTHNIEISAPHYYPQTKQISLAAGQESELNIKLRPKMGYLTIESGDNAVGAEVILNNGISIGNLPVTNYLIQEGDYTVRFNKKGFVTNDLDYRIQIEDRKITNFGKVNMLGLQKVKITSDPVNGAFVFIDGKQVGTTPLNIDLVIGQYKVLIKKEKYEDLSQTIDLQSNQRNFNYNLIPEYNFEIITKPTSATVYLGKDVKGSTPLKLSAGAGSHVLYLQKDGFVNRKTTIVSTDKPQKKTYSLKEYSMIGIGYQNGSAGTGGGGEMFIAKGKLFTSFSVGSIYSMDSYIPDADGPVSLAFQLGYRNPYPFEFAIHGGLGIRSFTNENGDGYNFYSPVVGLCKPIHFTPSFGIYFNVDYWPITEGSEGIILYSAGIFF